ncbi:CSC1-like protein HYP1 [Papaver somniferum]|uniref:CSC1-like protein HYP1 n=1 Tax=Papaver somniferum TaxID=3469 RepID=UPI000E6FA499|nr:CSC1-like protein HYP1 [Papaver somniferum]XP_026386292.1 CSC1-like protein HYP1 [Papaver somniferum]XP_026386293.1 CSC1-like protein HYP1 [Papaver somniferum]XP_026386295.1 CSC1-like protein HYP1 [Papaver somniferum]
MIVSALLTCVGINLVICVLYFTFYSILRKQPSYNHVYIPRLVAEGKTKKSSGDFHLDRLLPSTGWVRRAWQLSEDDLLSTTGLDAVVFMRIFTFSVKVFTVAAVIGIFILLPINYFGTQIHASDFADIPNKSLDLFSIANVNDGSKRLWVHFCVVYFITAFVCYLLFIEYKYISSTRIAYFYASKPQPHQFTVLVRGVPVSRLGKFSESIRSFFMEYHPSTYLSHTVVNTPSRIKSLIEVPAAFVSFKTRYGAAVVSDMRQSDNPTEWVTEQAPEPHDVYWPFFSPSFMQRWISKLVVVVLSIVLTVLFLIPVVFVQGLANLDKLKTLFPFLEGILNITFVSQVITGYLPSLVLTLFLKIVPPIMMLFSSMQGFSSYSRIERSACTKVLIFTVWNIFFANVLSGSAIRQVDTFLEPKNIPIKLAVLVPAQASFFIAYVVTNGWTSLSSEIFRVAPLLCTSVKNCVGSHDDEAPSLPFHSEVPRILFFGLLGLTYVFLAPLILPFLLAYFCLGYIIYRNQLLDVYEPRYESGGKLWPTVHNSTIFSLLLLQTIAIGIFGLKKLPVASTLILPLLIITLLFNEYCRKRFLPIFDSHSAESVIKKDRDNDNDPTMPEFLEKLPTAYRDPALKPNQESAGNQDHSTPLLSSV